MNPPQLLCILLSLSTTVINGFRIPNYKSFITNNRPAITSLFKKSLTSFITASSLLGLTNIIVPNINIVNIQSAKSEVDSTYNSFIPRTADVGVKEFIVKDGRQHLRLASPTVDPKSKQLLLGSKRVADETQKVQENLELIRLRLEQVGFSNPMVWSNIAAEESQAETIFKKNIPSFISLSANQEDANTFIANVLIPDFNQLKAVVQTKDGKNTFDLSEKTAADYFKLRKMQIPSNAKLPYKIPQEYTKLPYLSGYAEIEMKIASKKGIKVPDSYQVNKEESFIITVDGYHAPLTAGNFVDLVDKKFYDGMSIQRAEEQLVQTGKPKQGGDGYVDPATNTLRTIPLELFYKRDYEPVYGITSDDDNRATDTMALPFQAYGAVGMARSNDEEDSARSQIFFLKWLQALNPPGRNTLDGFFNCFGYITSPNENYIGQLTLDDTIISMKVISGLDNLKRP